MGTLETFTKYDTASALFGETKRSVLGLLYLHPEQAYFMRQIVRETGAGHGAVQRELDTLTRAGLLRRSEQGRQVYFRANVESPIFDELQGLLRKTSGLETIIGHALQPLAPAITGAFIFGSAARHELKPGSDIDLLVVGDASFSDIAHALTEAQAQVGRDVNPVVYPPAEFARKLQEKQHFLTSLRAEAKLYLIGDDRELGSVAKEWLGDETPEQPARARRSAKSRRSGLDR